MSAKIKELLEMYSVNKKRIQKEESVKNVVTDVSKSPGDYTSVGRIKAFYGDRKRMSDVSIILRKNGKKYPSHKLILAMTSSVFRDIFTKDSNLSELQLDEDEFAFEWFLEHCYTGQEVFSTQPKLLLNLLNFLRKYKLIKIKEDLIEHICNLLDVHTIDSFYNFALKNPEEELLNSECEEFIKLAGDKLIKYGGKYGLLTAQTFLQVLKQESLTVPEITILSNILKWAELRKDILEIEKKEVPLRECLKPYLSEVDFLSMGMDILLNHSAPKTVFSDAEILAIIMAINTRDQSPEETVFVSSYPSFLRKEPRMRRFNHQGAAIKYCKIISNPQCLLKNRKLPDSGVAFLCTFQSSVDLKLYQVQANTECFIGKFSAELISSDGEILNSSCTTSSSSWCFNSPSTILKGTSYTVRVVGPNRVVEHDHRMFSANVEKIEFSGQSIMCDIDLGFRV